MLEVLAAKGHYTRNGRMLVAAGAGPGRGDFGDGLEFAYALGLVVLLLRARQISK